MKLPPFNERMVARRGEEGRGVGRRWSEGGGGRVKGLLGWGGAREEGMIGSERGRVGLEKKQPWPW